MSTGTDRSRSSKGRRKSRFALNVLLENLMFDLATSGLPISEADFATMRRRCSGEGKSFIFKGLKTLETMLIVTLKTGSIPPQDTFRCPAGSTVPLFLGGLWTRIVDSSGVVLSDGGDPQAIAAILQIATALTKYEEGFPKELVPAAIEEFVSVDQGLADLDFPRTSLFSVAASIVTRVFGGLNLAEILPKHGPGAVATGEKQEEKWDFKRLYSNLDAKYPYTRYFLAHWSELCEEDRAWWFAQLPIFGDACAKLHIVPKNASAVRPISSEPLELQFIQQGQMKLMVEWLERFWLTAGRVNFTDQTINQKLALLGSHDPNEWATIDLSSASDRVSLQLVELLFRGVEDNVLSYLLASRSQRTLLPDGRFLKLNKFAPMGSAVCFPVQSVIFFALAVAAISIAENQNYDKVAGKVRVFGDDIIVAAEHMETVTQALELAGLRVNLLKSFGKGTWLRESCGVYAYKGVDITPQRFKKLFPQTLGDGRGWSAWVAYARACDKRGLKQTAEYLYTSIEEVIGPLPYAFDDSGFLGRYARSYIDIYNGLKGREIRWNDRYQRLEVRAYGVRPCYRDADYRSGWHRLMRNLLLPSSETDASKVVVPSSTKTKLGWHPVV